MKTTPTINASELFRSHWTEQEAENAKIVVDFIQTLMNDHNFDAILKNHSDSAYTQHNKAIPDKIEGLVEYVRGNVKRFPEFSYDVKGILASGDRVIFHSHVTLRAKHRGNEDKGFIIYDEWQVKDGDIVNHWDAIQPIDFSTRLLNLLLGGSKRNDNSIF